MSKRSWLAVFSAGLVAGGVLGTGIIVNAAVGDLIYEAVESADITGAQAADIGDEFIAKGAWTGSRADVIRCVVERNPGGPTNFRAFCVGTKSAPAASLPIGDGVLVVGVVE